MLRVQSSQAMLDTSLSVEESNIYFNSIGLWINFDWTSTRSSLQTLLLLGSIQIVWIDCYPPKIQICSLGLHTDAVCYTTSMHKAQTTVASPGQRQICALERLHYYALCVGAFQGSSETSISCGWTTNQDQVLGIHLARVQNLLRFMFVSGLFLRTIKVVVVHTCKILHSLRSGYMKDCILQHQPACVPRT